MKMLVGFEEESELEPEPELELELEFEPDLEFELAAETPAEKGEVKLPRTLLMDPINDSGGRRRHIVRSGPKV